MKTWQKMLCALIAIILGVIVAYNCFKSQIENRSPIITINNTQNNINYNIDQYVKK